MLVHRFQPYALIALCLLTLSSVTFSPQANSEGLADNPLIGMAMSQLGLDQTQAAGGLGSLLSVAQGTLGDEQFGQIAELIPNVQGLLGAVPAAEQDNGLLMNLLGGLFSDNEAISQAITTGSGLLSSFQALGLNQEMILPLVDLLKNYLNQQGGAAASELLTQGLAGFMPS